MFEGVMCFSIKTGSDLLYRYEFDVATLASWLELDARVLVIPFVSDECRIIFLFRLT